jgi:pimeloyl-ACP methyl ester carboxylesterase
MRIIHRALCIAALVTLGSTQVYAQTRVSGTWHGVITTPTGRLTLLFRFRDSAGAGFTGEMESPDQPTDRKFPLTKVVSSTSKLTFSIPSINASYEGEWNAKEKGWTGSYRQGMTLPLLLKRGEPPPKKVVEGLDGTWRGSVQRNEANLRLVLRVRTTPRGTGVTIDSPDVGAMGLEVLGLDRAGDTVRFQVPAAEVKYSGMLRDGQRSFRGQWSRPGQPSAEVTFVRDSAAPMARARSQMPITISGYRAEDVWFANPSDTSVRLAGTLTIPEGPGPFPAAVLISGSGGQDRDETIFGHKPFLVLADNLSRNGIAVLRYDDRGIGGSTGNHSVATSADFATDANSAVRYLLGRADIDHSSIGFIGHSEGGMIGPIAAVSNDSVAFLVLLAGPGTNTDQLMLSQRRLLGLSQGVSNADLDKTESIIRGILGAIRTAPDSQRAVARIRTLLTPQALRALGATNAQRNLIASQYAGPWMRYFLKYQPTDFLSRLTVPVLAVNGSVDRQVPSAENLAAMRVALADNKDATVLELPGLNHFFQTAGTGALGEYADLAETFAPSAMNVVTEWILVRFGKARRPQG